MKIQNFLLFALLFISFQAFSQDLKAVTSDGTSVILKSDGSWSYEKAQATTAADDNTSRFAKPQSASSSVKSRTGGFTEWYDPDGWKATQLTDGTADYEFASHDGSAYARFISEKMKLSPQGLRMAIEKNATRAAESFNALEEKQIVVNGNPVHFLKAKVVFQGTDFIFIWYYCSGDKGTVQLMAYTNEDLFQGEESAMLDFLNGLEF